MHRLRSSTASDGQGSTPTAMRRSFSLASLDEHLLAVVGGHLAKAIERYGAALRSHELAAEHLEAFRLLRNLYEHWDEQRSALQTPEKPLKQSAKVFAESFPGGRPYSISYATDDWYLGGVVPLNAVTEAVTELEQDLLAREDAARTQDDDA